jgi:hypothetical protein
MFYRKILFISFLLFLSNCSAGSLPSNKTSMPSINGFSNKGFALVYSDDLYNKKIVSRKINDRSLIIFQKNLKNNTQVKITNILNNKSLVAQVGGKSIYPSFNNSVLSLRIVKELDLDVDEPYIEIVEIFENSIFVSKKAKTYDEERIVAIKVPVKAISINNLNEVKTKNKKKNHRIFSYKIKIADFYFEETAIKMTTRIIRETLVKYPKIKKISEQKYRVYLGPFKDINSLQKSYNDIEILAFENIEIINND